MNEFYVTLPVSGKPDKFENDLQEKIYSLLDELNIEYKRVENEPAVTMEDCKNIDKAFNEETIKTIFLTNRQKTKFYLLAMPAQKPFITKDFGAALSIPRVSFADTELLMEILSTPHGAATPLSIVNDKDNKVMLVIDKEILEREKIVCTDGTLHGFICLSPREMLEKFIGSAGKHIPMIVSL